MSVDSVSTVQWSRQSIEISAESLASLLANIQEKCVTLNDWKGVMALRIPERNRLKILEIAAALFLASLVSICSGAAPPVIIGQNFTGSTFGTDSSANPPDTDGAIGPNHFVELINGTFSVYNKSTGARVQTMSDVMFWSRAGYTVPRNWDITDPRIVYDPTVQRWFAAQIDFDPSGFVNTNDFLLAVSATADPTGSWKAVTIPADPGGNDSADFPTLGLDSQGVYLSADMFDAAGNFAGPTVVSIPKAGLLGPVPNVSNRTWFGVMSYATRGHILQPAVRVDGGGGGSVLAAASIGVNLQTGRIETNTTLVGFSIQNTAGPGSATLSSSTIIPVPGYTAPINPKQPDRTDTLDDGDARMSGTVYRIGNMLFAVHSTEVNSRAALRWYRIDAVTYALLESGTISDPTLDLFYPSIAANTNGIVVIGCNGTSISTFVSCYAVVGQTSNGVTTFGNLLLLKSGLASYHMTSDPTSISRWGDYSATSVDPNDPTSFWTIQMYPSSASAWSTQITHLLTPPTPPTLTITRAGTNVLVCWTTNAPGFQLQSTSTLAPGHIWSTVAQVQFTNGNQICVRVPASGSQQFFRLVWTGMGALAVEGKVADDPIPNAKQQQVHCSQYASRGRRHGPLEIKIET